MSEQKEYKKPGAITSAFRTLIFVFVVGLLCFGSYVMGQKDIPDISEPVGSDVVSQSETKEIKFSDMGELVTQEAICTEVNVTDSSRELFGMKIPFTQTKYVYSYDVIIRAGIDFSQITYDVAGNVIEVVMPEAKIMSNELITESFKMYYEKESAFKRISLEENNEALTLLRLNAQESAIDNGLLRNAKIQAEVIIRGFFAQVFDPDEYTVIFTYPAGENSPEADNPAETSPDTDVLSGGTDTDTEAGQ